MKCLTECSIWKDTNSVAYGYLLFTYLHNVCTISCDNNRTLSSPQMQLLARLPSLGKELEPFFWTMYSVLALRLDWWTVPTMELAHITVPTLKMLVSVAALHVCKMIQYI